MFKNFISLTMMLAATEAANAQQASEDNTDQLDADVITVVGRVSNFGATKSDIPILETARSVSVIKADEFLEKGSLTLDDTLNYTAGVVGDSFGYSTRGDFPYVRGLDVPEYLDNVQVLFGYYNNARSDIYTLEQVEILKGPASVLYGQGSPGGILNTISKKASAENTTREIVVDYGTHNRKQIAMDVGGILSDNGNISGRLVTLYRDSDTQVDYVNDDAFVIAPSLTYEDESTRLTALINYTDRKSDTAHQFLPQTVTGCATTDVTNSIDAVCAGTNGQAVDNSLYVGDPAFNTYDTKSFSATLFAEQEINEIFSFEATARYRDNEADYKQTWVAFLGDGAPRTTPDGTAIGRSWYDNPASSNQFAVDARFRAEFNTDVIEHQMLAGVNYQDVDTLSESAYLYGLPTTFNLFNPDYSGSEIPDQADFDAARNRSESNTKTTGFYINDQITAGNFVINAGVRYDEVKTFNGVDTQKDSATSFSAGALYKTEIGLNPYISYSESFLAVTGLDAITNEPLKPQEGKQLEVGIKYQPRGTRTYITMAYFDIEQSNLDNPAGLPNAPTQQEGIADIKGFEVEAQTVIGEFKFDASYSYVDAKDPNGIIFPSVPKNQASAWVTWEPASGDLAGLRLGAGIRHASGNESHGTAYPAANDFAPTPMVVTTKGYTVMDALIGYDYGDMEFTLNLRNLFDSAYYGTCLARGDCFPGEGRTIVGRAKYKF
ncbi:TonB-dependent siderophore receptor [Pseudemcibacter aquimaris]|uniref:TonB-dependent siderophore receptor n=1 Tax=Pseudemcibacter aquimaris TaxID=2857064 RepID=UPI0020122AFB|nr:TonB-dependent siderophore receptor [Pseudemcibacter aquimaris]MCC3860574.1 TonB-dependent siderophore receptor [Pseudemcibacter aquimaris]WDU59397.1 TonB-dependent siderophore receptor [Pseudemcibacter aquimaris]